MWNNLFKHIDIDPKNAHILDGNAPDLVKECNDFEKKIAEAGGVELFLGGKNVLCLKILSRQIIVIFNNKFVSLLISTFEILDI